MKKTIILLAIVCFASNLAFADCHKGHNQMPPKTTVQQAKTMQDDTYVTLQGNITQKLSHDKYTFKDSTGSLTVEIDDDKWMGLFQNANDTVEIVGEIDKKLNTTEIEVDSIRKVTK